MRVLFSCHPGFGHLLPLIPLARACQRAGHDVLLATGPELCSVAEGLGLAATPVGQPTRGLIARYVAEMREATDLPGEAEFNAGMEYVFVRVGARARVADLVRLARDWEPDLIVHDPIEFAAPVAAALSGAARAIHGITQPPTVEMTGPLMPALETLFADWGVGQAAASLWDAPYLDIWPRALRPQGVLAARDVRPLRPEVVAPSAGERLPGWGDQLPYERTIYVTLGTAFNDAPGVFDAILAGLRGERVNLIVTIGPGGDPARLGRQPDGVIVERFLPQALVLPRCDAVICHGGAGTMLGALAHGLPLVLVPQGAEQFGNAAACSGAGAGIALLPGEVTPAAIRAATRRVLDGSECRERARDLAAEIAAMPGADSALARLAREVRPLALSR